MKILIQRTLYFGIIVLLFTLGFYKNQWVGVDMSEFHYRRDVSEIYILGRLVRSQQAGVFSDGGLLGIGDVDDSSVASNVINNQYDKYENGEGFSKYWAYKSHPGFQGILYSLFDSYTNLSPAMNLSILRLSISLLLSFILGIFCLWIVLEVGWLASISTVISILISKWLALLGGNLFWSMWSFYLPAVIVSLLLWKNEEIDNKWWIIRFTFIVFFVSLLKILFSGFEFITAGLLMVTVPFVYYSILNKWEWKVFVGRMMGIGIGLAGSVIVGLVILGIQVKSVIGNYKEAIEYIVFSWSKRTYGYEELLGDSSRASESAVGKTLEVVNHYLNGYAFSLSSRLSTTSVLIRDLLNGKYLFLILLFAVFTSIFLIQCRSSEKKEINRTGVALIVATWYSILSPLSWLVVFRDHAALHTRLDFIVWQMPYMLYGFALVGFVISTLVNYQSPK
ncbi:MAG TPA: hypothetical protein VLA72_10895 [Anaerolineales bacterium]|nr:hypothetical protein [Anaerolineales bacterium]